MKLDDRLARGGVQLRQYKPNGPIHITVPNPMSDGVKWTRLCGIYMLGYPEGWPVTRDEFNACACGTCAKIYAKQLA